MTTHNLIEKLRAWNREKWERKNQRMYAKQSKNLWVWHAAHLDPDYAKVLGHYLAGNTVNILDIGTCSGEQAIEMAKLGHTVTGVDVSTSALAKAHNNALQTPTLKVQFIEDDILDSQLSSNQFELITDRACFHSFYQIVPTELYINTIQRLLKNGCYFLIKAMSEDETQFRQIDTINGQKYLMPYHFKPQELIDIFSQDFQLVERWQSQFQTLNTKQPAIAEVALFRKIAY